MPRDPTKGRAHPRAGGTPRACFVACVLAVAALGGAPGAAASTPTSDAARLAAIHRLTPAQFAAIERVFVAAVPLDTLQRRETAPRSKVDAAARAFFRACGRLSARDPLLRVVRDGCPVTSELYEATAAVDACADAECLAGAVTSIRAALRRTIASSRRSDRAANATRLPRRCKRALLTPPGAYTAYRALDRAFGKLERALATGSLDDLTDAEAALYRADRLGKRLPTSKRLLARFRSG